MNQNNQFDFICRTCHYQQPFANKVLACPNCGEQWLDALKDDETLRKISVIVVTAKEPTVLERHRLYGKIEGLLHIGSFMDVGLIDDIREALGG